MPNNEAAINPKIAKNVASLYLVKRNFIIFEIITNPIIIPTPKHKQTKNEGIINDELITPVKLSENPKLIDIPKAEPSEAKNPFNMSIIGL